MKIGILGAGQLGMMLAEAGGRLGYTFRFMDPASDIPARGMGEHHCQRYEDVEGMESFIPGLDVITYEFENVPVMTARWMAERVPVYPPAEGLRVAQDRLFERDFFKAQGIPSAPYADFFFRDEFEEALRRIGFPCVLKTRRFGYDGKGQRVIRDQEQAEAAFKDLHGIPLFLEGFVPFERELSIIAVRSRPGECRFYPLVENHHREGILRLTIAPAQGVDPALQQMAERHARAVMESLDYCGVLAIEFFEKDGALLVNEMAPRVHNSGHWSIEGAVTSQFENHIRAVTGADLGETACVGASAMVNVIGEHIPDGALEGLSGIHQHDYGKSARRGRKLGHFTVTADTSELLRDQLSRVAERLNWPHLDSSLKSARIAR
jgi:5-(carboxyamino)imidazole ribonucleotide synthase